MPKDAADAADAEDAMDVEARTRTEPMFDARPNFHTSAGSARDATWGAPA